MTWHKWWRSAVVGVTLLAEVVIQPTGAAGQIATTPQSSPPIYAILLRDGRTATVWWDAVSDPTRPSWRCEMPAAGARRAARTAVPLTAAPGDWRAALAEAKAALKGLAADSD